MNTTIEDTATAKENITTAFRLMRVGQSLQSLGVIEKFNRRLIRLTNVTTCWGGHLKDATCHYRNAYEIEGNTYPIKDLLKQDGFKWDHSNKVWWKASCLSQPVAEEIIRTLKKAN